TGARSDSKPETAAGTNAMVYICPMPEHVAIKYDHSGQCPICGMTLVPVTEQTLAKLHPGGHIEYYLCPMTDACPTPEHGAVHYDKGGKCPVCGMTLIPVMAAPPVPASSKLDAAAGQDAKLPPLYTCAIHLDVVFDQPGNCPKCN